MFTAGMDNLTSYSSVDKRKFSLEIQIWKDTTKTRFTANFNKYLQNIFISISYYNILNQIILICQSLISLTDKLENAIIFAPQQK